MVHHEQLFREALTPLTSEPEVLGSTGRKKHAVMRLFGGSRSAKRRDSVDKRPYLPDGAIRRLRLAVRFLSALRSALPPLASEVLSSLSFMPGLVVALVHIVHGIETASGRESWAKQLAQSETEAQSDPGSDLGILVLLCETLSRFLIVAEDGEVGSF
jgi:hypothetical protein